MNKNKKTILLKLKYIYRKLKLGKANNTYQIGNYNLHVPPNFPLANIQKKYRLYDRFLPVLAKNLSSDKIIIDVGANIGDTVIALLPYCTNPIICIEPSDVFYSYLQNNLALLSEKDSKRVKTVKKLVGTGILKGELIQIGPGTATVKDNNTSANSAHTALDRIIEQKSDVVLIKVDTDGYDFDVLQSCSQICTESEPILFWENEISEDFQIIGFENLYGWLVNKGYKYVYVFDNFGNLMIEECDFKTLKNINSYIYSMLKKNCTRTIYYTDILAVTDKYHLLAQKAIEEYKNMWINK